MVTILYHGIAHNPLHRLRTIPYHTCGLPWGYELIIGSLSAILSPRALAICFSFHSSLGKKNTAALEKIQSTSLKVIFPNISYSEALAKSGLETLDKRRQTRCLNFSLKAANHPQQKRLFPPNQENTHNKRKHEKYQVNHTYNEKGTYFREMLKTWSNHTKKSFPMAHLSTKHYAITLQAYQSKVDSSKKGCYCLGNSGDGGKRVLNFFLHIFLNS